MERPDPYGEWVLRQNTEAKDGTLAPVDETLLAAARAAWPRVLAHARLELRSKNSEGETEALTAEVWESVLKSVAKALQRNREKGRTIANLEGYLFAAFHHRFNRFLKSEQRRDDAIELVSSSMDFDKIASAQDTRWVSELETTIADSRNDPADGWPDPKDLAGATVWLFVEGDFKVVGCNGTAGKDEVPIWSGENSGESAQDAKAKVRPVTDKLFLLSLTAIRRSILQR